MPTLSAAGPPALISRRSTSSSPNWVSRLRSTRRSSTIRLRRNIRSPTFPILSCLTMRPAPMRPSQIFTDLVFACNGSDSNIDLSRFVPVFAYEFNDPEAPPVGNEPVTPPNDVFGFPTASEHASELQFLFNFNT